MAAYSALLRGASQVFVVDKEADRLGLAGQIGVTTVDFSAVDPVEFITDATGGTGADCGVEAVGYQAHDQSGQEHPELVLDNLVQVVRATGHIGVVGVYVPSDPDAATGSAQQGRAGFDYGTAFDKGISIASGQCPVKKYNRELRDLIIHGRATPSFLVSHELPLDQAVEAYRNFDERADGWTTVLLHPTSREAGDDRHRAGAGHRQERRRAGDRPPVPRRRAHRGERVAQRAGVRQLPHMR